MLVPLTVGWICGPLAAAPSTDWDVSADGSCSWKEHPRVVTHALPLSKLIFEEVSEYEPAEETLVFIAVDYIT